MLSLLPEVSPDTGLCINGSFSSDLDPKLLVNPYNSQSGSLHLPKPKSRRENGGYKLALLRLTATERRKLPVTALQRHPDSAKSSESILRAHIELSSGVWDKDAATSMAGKPSRFFSPIVPIPMSASKEGRSRFALGRRPRGFRPLSAVESRPRALRGPIPNVLGLSKNRGWVEAGFGLTGLSGGPRLPGVGALPLSCCLFALCRMLVGVGGIVDGGQGPWFWLKGGLCGVSTKTAATDKYNNIVRRI